METDSQIASGCKVGRVLLLAKAPEAVLAATRALGSDSPSLCHLRTVPEFLESLPGSPVALALFDLSLDRNDVRDAARQLRELHPSTGQIWLAAAAAVEDSPQRGAFVVPLGTAWTPVQLRQACMQALHQTRLADENHRLKRRLAQRLSAEIIGHGKTINELRRQVAEAAESELPVQIWGEAGTGKNLAARVIHDGSVRAFRPCIRVSCGTLTAAHLERELFGWASDSRAGSFPEHVGRLELARGGVVVLDDVDQIAFPLQVKLCDAFQSRTFEKLGSGEQSTLDVRVITTSRKRLGGLASQGLFHSGFYETLCGITINTLPLREHVEDLAPLIEDILNGLAAREGAPVRRVPLDTLQLLGSYGWPGNVSELQSLIERACNLEPGPRLTADLIRPWLAASDGPALAGSAGLSLADMERKLIESTFARFGGNRERTAQTLKIGLRTLSGKLREYGYPPRGGPGSNRKGYDIRAA